MIFDIWYLIDNAQGSVLDNPLQKMNLCVLNSVKMTQLSIQESDSDSNIDLIQVSTK